VKWTVCCLEQGRAHDIPTLVSVRKNSSSSSIAINGADVSFIRHVHDLGAGRHDVDYSRSRCSGGRRSGAWASPLAARWYRNAKLDGKMGLATLIAVTGGSL